MRSTQGLAILPPDVNASTYRFEPVDARQVRYGLGGIKGTGEQAIESIVAARGSRRPVPRPVRLLQARRQAAVQSPRGRSAGQGGAFDAIDARRAALFASVGIAIEAAERAEAPAARYRCSANARARTRCRSSPPATGPTPSVSAHEKTALGFYLSGHPFNAFAAELKPLVKVPLANSSRDRSATSIAGIVTALRVQSGRRGKMAFVTLDDGRRSVEIIVYNETFDAARTALREDQLVVVEVESCSASATTASCRACASPRSAVHDLAEVRKR